jgi:hypothetical protein
MAEKYINSWNITDRDLRLSLYGIEDAIDLGLDDLDWAVYEMTYNPDNETVQVVLFDGESDTVDCVFEYSFLKNNRDQVIEEIRFRILFS